MTEAQAFGVVFLKNEMQIREYNNLWVIFF